MHKLTSSYLGLTLKSPVIVSSSRLTSNIDNLKSAEENGAGAVVLKSLFEEQIMYHINQLPLKEGFPEADDYISAYARSHSVDEYLNLIRQAKKELSIPVIASINCFSPGNWTDFSAKISDAGADALEMNAFFMPLDRKMSSSEAEKAYLGLVERVVEKLTIPVAMKIGTRFSNVLHMIDQFYARGVKGVVMFNRFYEPDIDIRRMQIVPAQIFSSSEEKRYVLRWIAMASAQGIRIDISASTGVKSGEDVIKYLLAGADTVQVCSVLYEKGLSYLTELNSELTKWMTERDYKTIGEFKGKLNWKNTEKPVVFERTQFMKYFSSID
jgi:dihydroorotate dehydrogenase (fumarate)